MTQKSWRKKLNHRIGERIFLDAHKDYLRGEVNRRPLTLYLANGIAGFVLITPFLLIAAGVWVFMLDFPNILFIILGVVVCMVGWTLVPRRMQNHERTYRRDELAALFRFFDSISDALGAARVDGIHITDDLNGYLWESGLGHKRERIIGIGMLLWDSTTPDQRIAFAAHEIAHQVNNDPARGRLVSMALYTLEQWDLLLSPSRYLDFEDDIAVGETLSEMMLVVPRFGVELIWVAMERLGFVEQQRAEYLADACAAGVSGVKPAIGLLEKLSLNTMLDKEMAGLHPSGMQSGSEVMMQLARVISHASEEERDRVLEEMRQEESAVDSTHPPTAFRIAFLSLLGVGTATVTPDQVDFDGIEAEIAPLREAMGDALLKGMQVQ